MMGSVTASISVRPVMMTGMKYMTDSGYQRLYVMIVATPQEMTPTTASTRIATGGASVRKSTMMPRISMPQMMLTSSLFRLCRVSAAFMNSILSS
ncbi:MAG: hypothetical protein A9Z00_14515 [Thermobacillus sp. ZCTH02-B1]|nr:MAG: hypothetical protein A9Z00_14515 [Thermobacillus sp. ZCTH02-B1]